jgi:hypothetical protein
MKTQNRPALIGLLLSAAVHVQAQTTAAGELPLSATQVFAVGIPAGQTVTRAFAHDATTSGGDTLNVRLSNNNVVVSLVLPGGSTVTESTAAAGASFVDVPVTVDSPFNSRLTQKISDLNVTWRLGQSGLSCSNQGTVCPTVGASRNPVFVTLGQSLITNETVVGGLMLTYIALAVGDGGATTQQAALANTWAEFNIFGPHLGVKTWDGRPLRYYSQGFTRSGTVAEYAVRYEITDGNVTDSFQCQVFTQLLHRALAINGIHSIWVDVDTVNGSAIVMKEWCLNGVNGCPGTPSAAYDPYWKHRISLNFGTVDLMSNRVNPDFGADVTNLSGIRGQGSTSSSAPAYTPTEKIFGQHFILHLTTLDGSAVQGEGYYDPSYWRTYSGPADFQTKSVTGFATHLFQGPGGDPFGTWRIWAAPSGCTNVRFN